MTEATAQAVNFSICGEFLGQLTGLLSELNGGGYSAAISLGEHDSLIVELTQADVSRAIVFTQGVLRDGLSPRVFNLQVERLRAEIQQVLDTPIRCYCGEHSRTRREQGRFNWSCGGPGCHVF